MSAIIFKIWRMSNAYAQACFKASHLCSAATPKRSVVTARSLWFASDDRRIEGGEANQNRNQEAISVMLDAVEICRLYHDEKLSATQLAKMYNTTRWHITKILKADVRPLS